MGVFETCAWGGALTGKPISSAQLCKQHCCKAQLNTAWQLLFPLPTPSVFGCTHQTVHKLPQELRIPIHPAEFYLRTPPKHWRAPACHHHLWPDQGSYRQDGGANSKWPSAKKQLLKSALSLHKSNTHSWRWETHILSALSVRVLRKEVMGFVSLRQIEKGWNSQRSATSKCCWSLRAGCSLCRPFKQSGCCSKQWRATSICTTDLVSLQAAHGFPDDIEGVDNGAAFRLGLLSLLPCMTPLWFRL